MGIMNTKLNLGCGNDIKDDCVNMDIVRTKGVDVVHDIEKVPYPFRAGTFEEIYCNHVLEHISNFNKVVEELWRIGKSRCKVHIISPHALGPSFFADPSHKTPICIRTFDNYDIDNPNAGRYLTNFGSKARFKVVGKRIIFSEHARIKGIRI
jgi:ubiquinone/menaquinone biosynthesis C-methylase UbiE